MKRPSFPANRVSSRGVQPALKLILIGTLTTTLGLALTGCSQTSLGRQALSFNRTVQEHRVEQLLLNVLRAAHREPMALTAVTSLSTSNSQKLSFGPIKWQFGSGASGPYDGALSGSTSTGPQMGLTILDNDPKFVNSFMKPVPFETIGFFVDQGWRMDFLAYLLLERIESAEYGKLVNDPGGKTYERFRQVLTASLDNLKFERPDASGQGGGFRIRGRDATLVMRSPQGVLFYLGELAGIQLETGSDELIPKISDSKVPLFLVEECLAKMSKAAVSVPYRNTFYCVPSKRKSRSMQALSFVQQLINIQSKEVQAQTQTIRLLDQ